MDERSAKPGEPREAVPKGRGAFALDGASQRARAAIKAAWWTAAGGLARENQVGPNRARAAPAATQTIPKTISAQNPGPSRRRRPYSAGSRGASESTGSGASVMRHSCPTRPRRAMFS